jgi:hypothetical protein
MKRTIVPLPFNVFIAMRISADTLPISKRSMSVVETKVTLRY